MVGNGPVPVGGNVTSTSSGVPSKLGTRWDKSVVGQKRTPCRGRQAWPSGSAAWGVAGSSVSAAAAAAISLGPTRPRLRHLAQLAGLHLVDEPPHRVLVGDERAVLDALDRVADVAVEVRERVRAPLRRLAGLVLQLLRELVVGEGEH